MDTTTSLAAHPRSRGENNACARARPQGGGSSPLTRGKLYRLNPNREQAGLIPAHAGKTPAERGREGHPAAHPRSRGENGGRVAGLRGVRGSSPLTRGKPAKKGISRALGRLIPAHAGKTSNVATRVSYARAHPRSRGENIPSARMWMICQGSSPLTRGKQGPVWPEGQPGGLIPAHAGKTTCWAGAGGCGGAHPRSRGENDAVDHSEGLDEGSSPLTRGKPGDRHGAGLRRRLIPAHAGKTLSGIVWPRTAWAHPRSRGENDLADRQGVTLVGSSPLTRGKLAQVAPVIGGLRLIPAHAGKTPRRPRRPASQGAHPRSRGENGRPRQVLRSRQGSSPLTRGKLVLTWPGQTGMRLIPAHAGKTPGCPSWPGGYGAHPRSRGENMRV